MRVESTHCFAIVFSYSHVLNIDEEYKNKFMHAKIPILFLLMKRIQKTIYYFGIKFVVSTDYLYMGMYWSVQRVSIQKSNIKI